MALGVAAVLISCASLASAWDDGNWVKIQGPGWLRLGCRYKTGWYTNSAQKQSWMSNWWHKDHSKHNTGSHKVNQYACTILNTGDRAAWEVRLSCRNFNPEKKWHINNDCSIPDNVPAYGSTVFVYQTRGGPARFNIISYYVKKRRGGDNPRPTPSPTPRPPSAGTLPIACNVVRVLPRPPGLRTQYQYGCSLTNLGTIPVGNITLQCNDYNPVTKWGALTWDCRLLGVAAANGGKILWGYQDEGQGASFYVRSYAPIVFLPPLTASINCKAGRTWKVGAVTYNTQQCSMLNPNSAFLYNVLMNCPNHRPIVQWGQVSLISTGICGVEGNIQPLSYTYWGYQTATAPTKFSVRSAQVYATGRRKNQELGQGALPAK